MNASTVITLKGVLALLLSILMGGCSVEIPDFNKVEFPCLEDSDCADGYECARSGEADGICIESGTTPVPVDCGPLTAPEGGSVEITATTVGGQATFACDEEGYQSTEENIVLVCEENGQWSGGVPGCSLVDCGDPESIAFASVTVESTLYGSVVEYRCIDGYSLTGVEDGFRTCEASGQWSGELPECVPDSVCGNGVREGDEVCDGGADASDDYQTTGNQVCNLSCDGYAPYCGDSVRNGPEACDDGNTSQSDACLNTCVPASCGDGFVWNEEGGTEECDDANESDTDACLNGCTDATCGDGFVWMGNEVCDDGAAASSDYQSSGNQVCNPSCSGYAPYCGDGSVSIGNEVCDGDQVLCSELGFGEGSTSCYASCNGYQPCPSSDKEILTYKFEAVKNEVLTADEIGTIFNGTITFNLSNPNLDPSELVATFTLSDGAFAKVSNVTQISGLTANNFTSTVVYQIFAEDGTSRSYSVTVPAVSVECGNTIVEAGEVCDDGDTIDNACSADCSQVLTQDCAGNWGGSAVVDVCGVCGGAGNTCFEGGQACGESVVYGETCYPVMPTELTSCYNNQEQDDCVGTPDPGISTCDATTFCGQDAQYPARVQRDWTCFSEGGEELANCNPEPDLGEIVRDNLTNLTWQRRDLQDGLSQPAAREYCEALEYGTYGDWRLPTLRELKTVIDLSRNSPSFYSDLFFGFPSLQFWTATEDPKFVNNGFIVEAEDGSHTRSLKTNQFFAVCVRGFPGDPRAPLQNSTYNGVAVFPDNLTGLMWDAATAVSVPWSQALSYCEGSTTGGLGDWRLPNKHELETVLELSNETPSILPVNADNAYWTSTTFAGEASRAWTVDLAGGIDTVQSKDEGFAAACVRSLRQASGNGTITEPSRELMWMQCPLGMAVNDAGNCIGEATAFAYCETNDTNCQTGNQLTSGPLFSACDSSTYQGYTDWRVPTKNELRGLLLCSNGYNTVESGEDCATGDGTFTRPTIASIFSGFPSTAVMSSTSAMSTTSSFYVDFFAGSTSIGNKTFARAALCVRDLP